MTLRLIAHNTQSSNYTSRSVDATGHRAGERLFLVVWHSGGAITNIAGAGTVLGDWSLEFYQEYTSTEGTVSTHRLSVYSIVSASALTGGITVTQASSGRIVPSLYAGPYDVTDTDYFLDVAPAVQTTPADRSVTLTDAAGYADARTVWFLLNLYMPSDTEPLDWSNLPGNVDILQENSNQSYRRVAGYTVERPRGVSFGDGVTVEVTQTCTSTSDWQPHMLIARLKLRPMEEVVTNSVYIPKVQAYMAPAKRAGAIFIPKAHAYMVNVKRGGLFVPKVQASLFTPRDPLDYMKLDKAVTYVTAGVLRGKQLMTKTTAYTVAGMDITRLPQYMTKGVVYAVTSYDSSMRLFQSEELQFGPEPPRWRLDLTYPYVDINEGQFSLFPVEDGGYALFILTDDGVFYESQISLMTYVRYDISILLNFNQIAIIKSQPSRALAQSVLKRMLSRRIESSTFS